MQIPNQHPLAPSAHKVTEEQGWTGTSRVADEPKSLLPIDVNGGGLT
jgi:hypothetical protein